MHIPVLYGVLRAVRAPQEQGETMRRTNMRKNQEEWILCVTIMLKVESTEHEYILYTHGGVILSYWSVSDVVHILRTCLPFAQLLVARTEHLGRKSTQGIVSWLSLRGHQLCITVTGCLSCRVEGRGGGK